MLACATRSELTDVTLVLEVYLIAEIVKFKMYTEGLMKYETYNNVQENIIMELLKIK